MHEYFRIQNNSYSVRTTQHQGKAHLIVPVIMMVEGVHCGNFGCVHHTSEELSKFPSAWNGRPVVIHHPTDENGNGVCANDPDIENAVRVGTIYKAFYDNRIKGLRAEAWLDRNKLEEVSPQAYNYIDNQRPLDVSIGVFCDHLNHQGVWNGEQYAGIAANYRPDHLALLPGSEGACGWADGCGVRLNKSFNERENNMSDSPEPMVLGGIIEPNKSNLSDDNEPLIMECGILDNYIDKDKRPIIKETFTDENELPEPMVLGGILD